MSGRGIDRVAATGAMLALLGCALPLVVVRPNRIASGVAHGLLAGGPVAGLLALVALAAAAFAIIDAPWRSRALMACAASMLAVLPWALGAAALAYVPGSASTVRVSLGSGAWVMGVAAAVVWFAARSGELPKAWRATSDAAVVLSWIAAAVWGGLARLSIAIEYAAQPDVLWQAIGTHLQLVGISLALALAIGVPLGIAASRVRWVRAAVLGVVGVVQTVPSLALLGLLVVPLAALGLPGIGLLPGVIALTLYALLPIVRDTYLGIAGVDPAAIDAGLGMGMSRAQLLVRVEAPLALPLLVEGARAATVMIIGIAAVVAFVGVRTLGWIVFFGWGQQADDFILLGAVPMVVLAVAADIGLRRLARTLTPRGIRTEGAA